MTYRMVLAGFGGQGMLSLGQIVAYTALKAGKEVTWMPSYGPEMRGGTANCSVIIDDKKIGSPIVDTNISHLFAMNKPSLLKFADLVAKGGTIYVNSSLIKDDEIPQLDDVNIVKVNATDLASEIGNIKVQNMVMLGSFLGTTDLLTVEQVKSVMEEKFTGGKAKFIPMNLQAIEKGMNK